MNINERPDLPAAKLSKPKPNDGCQFTPEGSLGSMREPEAKGQLIIGVKNPGNWITKKSYIIIALCLFSTIMCILGTYAYFRYL